jgi:branched-chain amino acid transport system ATP-binding protein
MTLLAVAGLRKAFGGVQAVASVSFALEAGEILAMIGPNGAGKSTCFAMLGGQVAPDAGRIVLDGAEIGGRPARAICRLGVGRTFQITATFASMTVRENVQVALVAHRRESGSWWQRLRACHGDAADALLAQVGLAGEGERGAGVLAYGDLKRLELAIALAGAPRLLLMDEPTSGMAPAERIALMRLVRDLARQRSLAVLFTEHDMDVVFGIADRILVLDRGGLIAEGPPDAIRADPRVRAVYLGEPA